MNATNRLNNRLLLLLLTAMTLVATLSFSLTSFAQGFVYKDGYTSESIIVSPFDRTIEITVPAGFYMSQGWENSNLNPAYRGAIVVNPTSKRGRRGQYYVTFDWNHGTASLSDDCRGSAGEVHAKHSYHKYRKLRFVEDDGSIIVHNREPRNTDSDHGDTYYYDKYDAVEFETSQKVRFELPLCDTKAAGKTFRLIVASYGSGTVDNDIHHAVDVKVRSFQEQVNENHLIMVRHDPNIGNNPNCYRYYNLWAKPWVDYLTANQVSPGITQADYNAKRTQLINTFPSNNRNIGWYSNNCFNPFRGTDNTRRIDQVEQNWINSQITQLENKVLKAIDEKQKENKAWELRDERLRELVRIKTNSNTAFFDRPEGDISNMGSAPDQYFNVVADFGGFAGYYPNAPTSATLRATLNAGSFRFMILGKPDEDEYASRYAECSGPSCEFTPGLRQHLKNRSTPDEPNIPPSDTLFSPGLDIHYIPPPGGVFTLTLDITFNTGESYTKVYQYGDIPGSNSQPESGNRSGQSTTEAENPSADLITEARKAASETEKGNIHVDRWLRILAALGVDNGSSPMTAAEAQSYVDRGWTRYAPYATELARLESASTEGKSNSDSEDSGTESNTESEPEPETKPAVEVETVDPEPEDEPDTEPQIEEPQSEPEVEVEVEPEPEPVQCVSSTLRADVLGYSQEIITPDSMLQANYVDRWIRALHTLDGSSGDNTMMPAEARGYANKGWARWVPVADAIDCLYAQAMGE
ncbi:MAG: procyclic acidic repetitive family protein [Gammaproteobacteria bacterium]|nr:procyclic acidic repetitive family protein [Gammaproteobacteria bacterium]